MLYIDVCNKHTRVLLVFRINIAIVHLFVGGLNPESPPFNEGNILLICIHAVINVAAVEVLSSTVEKNKAKCNLIIFRLCNEWD